MLTSSLKICLLGTFAVGKTSLVRRRVEGIFDENYETTVGVRVDPVRIGDLRTVFWDLPAEDRFQSMSPSHLRGTRGLMLIADVTRGATVEAALHLATRAQRIIGSVPALMVLNKSDRSSRDVNLAALDEVQARGIEIVETSARTARGVNEAFARIVKSAMAVA